MPETATLETNAAIEQAEIEYLETMRHTLKMQIAAVEKRLATLGRTFASAEKKTKA